MITVHLKNWWGSPVIIRGLKPILYLSMLRKKVAVFTTAALTTTKLEESKKLWILYDQSVIISKKSFTKGKNPLNCFYDESNLLTVKAWISSVKTFSYDKKYSILLIKDSHVTKLIVLNTPESVCHKGLKH